MHKELFDWIKDRKEEGYSEEEIAKMLKENGYDDEHIDSALHPTEKDEIRSIVEHKKKKKFDINSLIEGKNKYITIAVGIILILIIALSFIRLEFSQMEDVPVAESEEIFESETFEGGERVIEEQAEDVILEEGDTEIVQHDIADEPTDDQLHIIIIDNFLGNPEDVNIKVGDIVRFVNEQDNFKHIIGIREWIDGEYERAPIDDYNPILTGESYEYMFKVPGDYLWFSKANYPRTSGQIKVV